MEAADDVVSEIETRFPNRFAYISVSCEMHNGIDIEFLEGRSQTAAVSQFTFHQRSPPDGVPVTIEQVVIRYRPVSRTSQRLTRVTADVSCPTGHQNGSGHFPSAVNKARRNRDTFCAARELSVAFCAVWSAT